MMYHVASETFKPSAGAPGGRFDLDVSPCPTVTAVGLRGASRHDHWLACVPEKGEGDMGEAENAGTSLGHMPAGQRWAFDGSVADVFDDMLTRSIPEYETMRRACFEMGRRFVRPRSDVVDLGSSRGAALLPFVAHFGTENRYVATETSEPMLHVLRRRFAPYAEQGIVSVLDFDLRTGYPAVSASLTLSVLTLQFVPLEHRLRVLRDAFLRTLPGGAFLLVEKILGASADINERMVEVYYDFKRANGYTEEEITRKRLSLEGVLVPVTAQWNEHLLLQAGYRQVDCFWRWMNFAAWVGVRDA
jgi:tRNA (cmo5U34)-methyltransferase